MTILKWICAGLVLLWIAAPATAQRIAVCYDQAADFSRLRTYAWKKAAAKTSELDRRIIDSIDRQLQARGLQRVDSNADAIVSYHAAVVPEFEHAARGSLIVSMVDRKAKQELWRAQATNTIQEEIDKVVERMFRQYPVAAKEGKKS